MTGVKLNDSTDLYVWTNDTSAKEKRNQLRLRYPERFNNEWLFKDNKELIEIIKDLIEKHEWVLVEEKDKTYWEKQTIPMIKGQIIRRGGNYKAGKLKQDYLGILYDIMKI